jgi:hypothetical protein
VPEIRRIEVPALSTTPQKIALFRAQRASFMRAFPLSLRAMTRE